MTRICILAVDTTSLQGSVAIVRDHELIHEAVWEAIDTHSNRLMAEVDSALKRSGMNLEEVTHYAGLRGPGSFTGIRVGLGTLQGLAGATRKPMLGVTTLEALAFSIAESALPITAVIDARRNQVYRQTFRREAHDVVPIDEPVCEAAEEWLAAMRAEATLLVGSGALLYRQEIEAKSPLLEVAGGSPALAALAARLASRRLSAGKMAEAAALDALYVRPPDVLLPKRK